jgi:hypothetical protein
MLSYWRELYSYLNLLSSGFRYGLTRVSGATTLRSLHMSTLTLIVSPRDKNVPNIGGDADDKTAIFHR